MQTIQNINILQAILEATVSAFYNHVGEINPAKEFDYYVKYKDGKMAVHLYFVDYFTESKFENDPHINHLDKQELSFSEDTKISKAVNDITTELERIHNADVPDLKYKHDLI